MASVFLKKKKKKTNKQKKTPAKFCLLQMTTYLQQENDDVEQKSMSPREITATPSNRSCGNNQESHLRAPL